MSVCVCHRCGDFVDTDFNVEGVFESVKPWKYYCGSCVQRAFEDGETAETDRALAAYKADAPAEYAEAIECRRSDDEMRAARAEYDAAPLSERDPERYSREMSDAGRGHLLTPRERNAHVAEPFRSFLNSISPWVPL